ncbi:MAG: hypothetical protein SOZ80_06260 [Prevotella sp.]|nr:hypothetical protein [Prevotella sp.]MDD7318557.1 hypothetical protein [Prevotellaceae bacterium]MDY4020358.1 hypothetical protein [Prevotella sp.]
MNKTRQTPDNQHSAETAESGFATHGKLKSGSGNPVYRMLRILK